jgi:glycosyltransferase involved in cell wall biosynthesis
MAALPPGRSGEIRILRIFSRLNVGGPSLHVIHLAAGLGVHGFVTRLVVGHESEREGNLMDLALERHVDVLALSGLGREIRPFSDLRALVGLVRLARRFRPHVVHTHTAKAGVLGRVAARLARVPVLVHTYHGHVLREYFGRLTSAVFCGIERLLARGTDGLVTVSESVKADLVAMRIAPAERIRVVRLGLELAPFTGALPRGVLRADAGFPAEAPLVGMVGRLVPVKDVSTFLRSARLVHAARPDARFSLVGDGPDRAALEAEVASLGLTGAVRFHGWRRDLPAVYGDLDVVVNASRNEGTPVALIEALAAGRPVVATAVGGTPDVLEHGAHGALVPAQDERALADAIQAALETPPSAERVAAARAHVLARYGVPRLLSDLAALYRELLHARGVA